MVELVIGLRCELSSAGLDAGADTIVWHLAHHHQTTLSRPMNETFEVHVPRTITDANGDRHDCAAPEGCRIVACWGNDTYYSDGVATVAWFRP